MASLTSLCVYNSPCASCASSPSFLRPPLVFQVSAAEHLRKLEKLDEAAQKVMNAESKAYLSRLHTRKLEEDAARKEREMRRRKVMLEQDAAQDALEEKRREDLILAKLARQCAEEVKIGEQMWVARKEKEVMRKNRQLRDEQWQCALLQCQAQLALPAFLPSRDFYACSHTKSLLGRWCKGRLYDKRS